MSTSTPTKQAWTLGPWRIDGVLPNEPMNIEGQAFDGSWKYICIAIHGGNPKQREANAKLIAKAPEMAEILIEFLAAWDRSSVFTVGKVPEPTRADGEKLLAVLEKSERILREAGAI